MRRHAHSCDQCRKSKRACDAPQLTLPAGVEADRAALLSGNLQPPPTPPCSYCKKTSKECTMNWAWNQLQLTNVLDAYSHVTMKQPQSNDPDELSDSSSQSPQGDRSTSAPISGPGTMPSYNFPASMAEATPGMMASTQGMDGSLFPGHLPGSVPDGLFNFQTPFDSLQGSPAVHNMGMSDLGFGFGDPIPHSGPLEPSMSYAFPNTISPPSTAVLSAPFDQANSDFAFGVPTTQSDALLKTPLESASSSSRACSTRSDSYSDSQPDTKRRRFTPSLMEVVKKPSISSFSVDQQMMKLQTRSMFSENLIRVYHDVLEHNMSCWVTEATCPYSGALCRAEGRRTAEWGASWTNRILDRTMKLDASSKASGLVNLTRAQDQAATRAVQMAIMAFATQWAQGSSRQNERYTRDSGHEQPQSASFDFADSLDRMAQQHFWREAQKAMNEVADVESYGVVCAEIILGFTQKPWMPDDVEPSAGGAMKADNKDSFDMDSLLTEISRCIEKDGPPVYLERAARKAHALKFRATSAAKGIAMRQGLTKRVARTQVLSREDEKTAGLLYWLAVMADTISSSMNERPITVNDEDSQHDLDTDEDREGGRWKVDLFLKDNLDKPMMKVHWPCAYEEAAEAVTIASPAKILMYRHVSYLQGMLRRGQGGKKLEDVIRSAMRLWGYWNKTHGQFFRELVDDAANVPVRIRGWFFCLSAHWHLAVLLLVGLVEYVDNEELGSPNDKRVRDANRTLAGMKETSLREVSDLGRMSLPPSESDRPPLSMLGDPSQSPGFHHAISEATILSEPWTIILIRVFSKVAAALLEEVHTARQIGLSPPFGEADALRRAEDCIKTLFYLGKKSDMARRVADVLSEAMCTIKTPSPNEPSNGDGGRNGNFLGKFYNMTGHMNDSKNGAGSGNGFGALDQRDFMGMAMPTA